MAFHAEDHAILATGDLQAFKKRFSELQSLLTNLTVQLEDTRERVRLFGMAIDSVQSERK